MIFNTHIQVPLPQVGFRVSYESLDGTELAEFTVVDVNKDTGCIYLSTPDKVLADRVLEVDDTDKHGKPILSKVFGWDDRRKLYAVNVAWDVWHFGVKPLDVPPVLG